ncbi:MAG: hypothetical protein K2Y27_08025 [Xanthobacteraceae bacterium]|nr:hypothetical protein [Xanthobacteraceae bacterium]
MSGTLATVRDFSEATLTSLAAAMALFFAAIPKIIGFLVVVIIGWIVAALIASAIAAVLRRVRFNELAVQSGFSGFIQNTGMQTDASGAIALTVKWFVRLIALVVAFDALGLPAVSDVLRQLLLWIPNLVVGIVVLVIGGLAANALANLIRGATAQGGLGNPDVLATIAKVMVWGFAIVVAVNQIGIAQTLVNALFIAVVGAAAIALGLAFGLGGKDTAAKIVQDWYAASQTAGRRTDRTVESGSRMQHAAGNPQADPARRQF